MIEQELTAIRRQIVAGDLPAARAMNRQLLARSPDHPAVLLQAARIESLSGNYRQAQQLTFSASKKRIQHPRDLKNLLHRLQVHQLRAAILDLTTAHPPESIPGVPLLDVIATTLNQINEPVRALAYLDHGLGRSPDSVELLASRAQTLYFLGRFSEAAEDIGRCLSLAPTMGFCWWLRSRVPGLTWSPGDFDAMRKLLSKYPSTAPDAAYMAYALHNAHDAMCEYDLAAAALQTACELRRPLVHYDEAETDALFGALAGFRSEATLRWEGDQNPTPIFIVGMHRSGTTLLEQLLDAQPGIQGLGELYDFTAQMRFATNHHCRSVVDTSIVERANVVDFAKVGAGYLQAVAPHLDHQVTHFIDKLPPNFLNAAFICEALPEARILHMERDPMETCFSNLREPFSEHTATYSYNQRELSGYYLKYRRLMAHWHERYPDRFMAVDYGELTRNPETTLRRVAEFCAIPFDASRIQLNTNPKAITTASAGQARGGITVRESPKWAPYRSHLDELALGLAGT